MWHLSLLSLSPQVMLRMLRVQSRRGQLHRVKESETVFEEIPSLSGNWPKEPGVDLAYR